MDPPRPGRRIVYVGDTRPSDHIAEFAQRADVLIHEATFSEELLERAEEVFERGKKTETGSSIKELHAKIGQLAVENDFLSVALGRIAEPSAKR